MSYSYHARIAFKHNLHQTNAGRRSINSRPAAETNVVAKVGAWGHENTLSQIVEATTESVEEILNDHAYVLSGWVLTYRELFNNHLLVAAVVIDNLGRNNVTELTMFRIILSGLKDIYAGIHNDGFFWPAEYGQCRQVMADVIDFLLTRCIETLTYAWNNSPESACFINMQCYLEHAFIPPPSEGGPYPRVIMMFKDSFNVLFRNACYLLWTGPFDGNCQWEDDDDDDDYRCRCRTSIRLHDEMTKSENSCRKAVFEARRRQRRGPNIQPISREMHFPLRTTNPSPLGKGDPLTPHDGEQKPQKEEQDHNGDEDGMEVAPRMPTETTWKEYIVKSLGERTGLKKHRCRPCHLCPL